MHCLQILLPVAALVATALATSCNHDNCFRAVIRYERETAPSFCSKFLATATPKPQALGCSPKRISSACSCLTTATASISISTPPATSTISTPPPTSTLSTSTCERTSTTACPAAVSYTPCCAYLCAEAQVPFRVCSPENETVLAQCEKCPSPTKTPTTTPSSTKTPTTPTSTKTPTITPSKTTTSSTSTTASTCTRSSASACPTPKNKCCNYLCSVAQVPFEICSETDTSGQFEVCRKCGA